MNTKNLTFLLLSCFWFLSIKGYTQDNPVLYDPEIYSFHDYDADIKLVITKSMFDAIHDDGTSSRGEHTDTVSIEFLKGEFADIFSIISLTYGRQGLYEVVFDFDTRNILDAYAAAYARRFAVEWLVSHAKYYICGKDSHKWSDDCKILIDDAHHYMQYLEKYMKEIKTLYDKKLNPTK